MSHTILAINPGSTSTKLSLFHEYDEVQTINLSHSAEEIGRFAKMADQKDFRSAIIKDFLKENKVDALDAVVGRGGLLRPIESGVYEVSESMLKDLGSGSFGEHASNLGGILAQAVANEYGCRAFIADPVVVDEMDPVARFSGTPEIERKSIFHALNQKSSARAAAKQLGQAYTDCNLIVAHMGGGISVGAHKKGRVVDVNNALDGDGAFSPERTGSLPVGQLVALALSGTYTHAEIKKKLVGKGGVTAYLGTNDMREVIAMIDNGDKKAKGVFEAMIYQVSQEIAKHSATLCGQIDAIVLTGGIAYNEVVVNAIKSRVGFLAKMIIIPGEREMVSLSSNALSVLNGEVTPKEY